MKTNIYKIEEIAEVKSGKRIPKGMNFSDCTSDYKYIRARDIKNGLILVDDLVYIDENVKKKINKYIIEENDIAITIVGENIGDVGICTKETDKANLTENACRLTDYNLDIVYPKYLLYYLNQKYMKEYMKLLGSGAAQGKLGNYKTKRIKIELPSVQKQVDIVDIVEKYDLLIQNNSKRIKILEQMAEELYKEWFVRFRFPGHENVKFENGIPKNWKIKKIDDIGTIIGGGTPSTSVSEFWEGNIPWITPADLANYPIPKIKEGHIKISELGLNKSGTKLLPQNTILLSSRAPIGYVAIASNPICTNQGFKSVICNEKIIDYCYLYHFFKNNTELLNSYGSGATFLELSSSGLKKIKMLIPPLELQSSFSKVVIKYIELSEFLYEENKNLIKQRDLLLPRLMSGRLEVK